MCSRRDDTSSAVCKLLEKLSIFFFALVVSCFSDKFGQQEAL
jgi:hypothetical protein